MAKHSLRCCQLLLQEVTSGNNEYVHRISSTRNHRLHSLSWWGSKLVNSVRSQSSAGLESAIISRAGRRIPELQYVVARCTTRTAPPPDYNRASPTKVKAGGDIIGDHVGRFMRKINEKQQAVSGKTSTPGGCCSPQRPSFLSVVSVDRCHFLS